MIEHTPGPWKLGHAASNHIASIAIQAGGGRGEIAVMSKGSLADARLIAAAPEMLEALEQFVRDVDDLGDFDHETYCEARAAVARATGQQPGGRPNEH